MYSLTKEQKDAAGEYVSNRYCSGSDDNIESNADGDSPDEDFSLGDEGVWVKAWVWCPKEEIPGYMEEDE